MCKVAKTLEQIEKSKQNSMAAYQARRAEQDQKTKEYKEGLAFAHKNEVKFMVNSWHDDMEILIGVFKESEADEGIIYRYAYAVCGKKDKFVLKTGKALVGNRLSSSDEKWSFVIGGARDNVSMKAILNIGMLWINMSALAKDPDIPDCIAREIEDDCFSGSFYRKYIGLPEEEENNE